MKHLVSISLVFLIFISFSCNKEKRFAIDTEDPIDVYACRATFKATGKKGTNKKITDKGFCYSESGTPVYENNTSPSTNGFVDLFEAKVTGLTANTKYYVRAYTKFKDGDIVYGDLVEFQTNGIYMIGDRGPAKGFIYATGGVSDSKYSEVIFSTSQTYPWGCDGNELNGIDLGTGGGSGNTNTIANNCGTGTAAAYCLALDINGYSDWYLPNVGELSLMNSFCKSYPDAIPLKEYWSSSQWDANQAYSVNMAAGSSWLKNNKNSSLSVVAVRAFN